MKVAAVTIQTLSKLPAGKILGETGRRYSRKYRASERRICRL